MKKIFLAYLLFISATTLTMAQADVMTTQPDANLQLTGEESMIVSTVHNFYNVLKQVASTKEQNFEPLTRFLDKNFTSSRYTIELNGEQTRTTNSLEKFKTQIAGYKNVNDLQLNFDIERFNFVKVFESFAVVNYSVMVSATLESEPIIRYKSIVTSYLHKGLDGMWIILESNGVNVIKDQEIGICPCSITKNAKDENKYEVNIMYPAGSNLQSETIPFEFKQTLITSNENTYTQQPNGVVTLVKSNGNTVSNQLGKASTKPETISLILSQHLFQGKCTGYKPFSK